MLNHPDVQLQYILTTLENQRDNLMIENGNLSARNKELEARVAALEPPKEDALTEEGDGEPIA
jgi:cell division protein FtsB